MAELLAIHVLHGCNYLIGYQGGGVHKEQMYPLIILPYNTHKSHPQYLYFAEASKYA